MAGLSLEIKMPRRRAVVNINSYMSRKLGIPEGETPCYVLGVFQESSDDGPYTVAVCELRNGRVAYANPDAIRFVDIEEEAPL
jgi:hypothetical protein